jgi:hypothetical protein
MKKNFQGVMIVFLGIFRGYLIMILIFGHL